MSEFKEQEDYFETFDKLRLFYRCWNPSEANGEKAVFVGVHGGEVHSKNLQNVAEFFSRKGYPFYAFDRRGHGHAEEKDKMFVKDYNLYVEDIKSFILFVKEKESAEKIYLVAHSNGGGQSIITATRYPELIDKMILSAPSLKLYGNRTALGIQKNASYVIGTLAPKFTIKSPLKPEEFVKDNNVVEERTKDELIHGKLRARWVREMFRFQNDANKNIHKLQVPTLFMIGTDDKLVDSYHTMTKFETIEQKDKMKLNIYEGYWHELFNEKPDDRLKVFQDIEEFIKF